MLAINISNFTLLLKYTAENSFIAISFLLVAFINNIYSHKNLRESIIGNFYLLFSMLCIFAADFLTMFLALEMMMICATILIFFANHRIARQYFLTHVFSGSLNLIATILLLTKLGNLEIINLTYLFNAQDTRIIACMMLASCLINVASFPFSGWMINSYPKSSGSSFVYLVTFTSNASMLILIKLFSGLALLKFFGIVTILYGSIYSCFERSLKKIFCYMNVATFGFMMVIIGGEVNDNFGIIIFLFISILYKALFASSLATLSEVSGGIMLFCLFLSAFMMIGAPPLASFVTKTVLINNLGHDIYYYSIILMQLLISISSFHMLIRLFSTRKTDNTKLVLSSKYSLLLVSCLNIAASLFLHKIVSYINPLYKLELLDYKFNMFAKQIIIIIIAGIIAFVTRNFKKISTKNLDLDLFQIVDGLVKYIFESFKIWNAVSDNIALCYNRCEKLVVDKITSIRHTQSSIFIVILLLILFFLR